MGQRHQVYIIAGNKVLAAFHWQWLFGQRAALSATRFINAAKNPVNAMIIEADIETYWETNNTIPCPYITWLYLHVVQHGVDHQDLGNCCPIDIDMDIQMIGESL